MRTSATFRVLKTSFEKFRIAVNVYSAAEREKLQCVGTEGEHSFERAFLAGALDLVGEMSENTIYKVTNSFEVSYVFFLHPTKFGGALVSVGPFGFQNLTAERVLEISEKNKLSPANTKFIEQYYSLLPVLEKDSHLFYLLESYCEEVWKKKDFFVREVEEGAHLPAQTLDFVIERDEQRVAMANVQLIERRYQYENLLMEAVATGQMDRIRQYLSSFNSTSFKQRQPDMLREMKNYCIICNTILRKAAERGGVHPFFLDEASSAFARRIERLSTKKTCIEMLKEMALAYGKMVAENSTGDYSPIVKSSVVYIWNHLQEPLTLSHLAERQNVSKGYLSAIFKKETGKTLTEFVREARIKNAIRLLQTTNLQVQTVSQYCGILDLQYFCKQFKRVTGKSPKEYR